MPSLAATARLTGAAYLGLALTGMAGHLALTAQLAVPGDPAATLERLRESPGLAQLALVLELLVVITQALAAWGFFALFRRDHPAAAFGTAAFGLGNALAILGSASFLATALAVSGDAALAPGDDAAATVGLLYALSGAAWDAGRVFFGLWLIPMGVFALSTRRMPGVLGWALVVGGAGYVLGALLGAVPALAPVGEALSFLATVGELWMVGYLLSVGIRPSVVRAPAIARAASA
jgi:hypothetical protein